MMTPLVAIRVGKKALGIDDDSYSDLLRRLTGKASSAAMTSVEHDRVCSSRCAGSASSRGQTARKRAFKGASRRS
jgi:phage gp16-like protein